MDAVAEQLDGRASTASRSSPDARWPRAADEWTVADVSPPAEVRLYLATASEQWLGERDRRTPVSL